MLCLLLTMSVMMLSLFLYAEDIYGATEELAWMRTFYRYASAVLTTPVMVLCGAPLARRALKRLREGVLSMSALILVAAVAAYLLSLRGLWIDGATYFESASAALVLATLGRYLEATARARASGIVGPGVSRPVDAAGIARGDVLVLRSEEIAPVDLRATSSAEVDTGVLTGESTPVPVRPGSEVPAGAVVLAGPLEGVATSTAEDSTLAQLDRLARSVRDRNTPLLRRADRFARALTPLVWGLAIVTFGAWSWTVSVEAGVVHALSVVLVACPCSYAIGAPLLVWLSMRRALERGVLVRNASTLERLADITWVGFDKTGTLTEPELTVEGPRDEASLGLLRALESGTRHPVGRALLRFAGEGAAAELTSRRVLPGRGVEGTLADRTEIAIGADGTGGVTLRIGPRIVARYSFAERLREEAQVAVSALRDQDIEVAMLTGDQEDRAAEVAGTLGIPFFAELNPAEKVAHLEMIGQEKAMVGDGLNDAPALAGLAVGFAMPDGSGLAKGLAQVNLARADLALVPWTLELARSSVARVGRLLWGSTAYNLIFLGLAAGGLLRPVWAGLSMLISSLVTVVLSARSTV